MVYNIIETRRVNGIERKRAVNNEPLPIGTAVKAIELIAKDIENNDRVFGGYLKERINEHTPKWSYNEDPNDKVIRIAITDDMGWGISAYGNSDFELSYAIVETDCSQSEEEAFICLNTAKCVDWATTDEPLIQTMRTRKDFCDLGFNDGEYDHCKAIIKYIGIKQDNYYDGVYIIPYTNQIFDC